jgi:hypothetical protein
MLIVIWWKVSYGGNWSSHIESFNQPSKHYPCFVYGNYSFYYNIINLIIVDLIKWYTKSLRCILSIIIIKVKLMINILWWENYMFMMSQSKIICTSNLSYQKNDK